MSTLEEDARSKLSATVFRKAGAHAWGRVTNFNYAGCEIRCADHFDPGEDVSVHIKGLGNIRARVVSASAGVLSVSFIEESPF